MKRHVIFNYTYSSFTTYLNEIQTFEQLKNKKKIQTVAATHQDAGKNEIHVVVIGESLNKNHMQIYGYPRATTPQLQSLLDSHKIIKFNNTFANHTHTTSTLSMALTEANQNNQRDYFDSVSIMDVANAAGFQTYWLSNQNMHGHWDNIVSLIATQAQEVHSINKNAGETVRTSQFDGALLPFFDEILAKEGRKKVIFVHLMGNHNTYCQRYPKKFATFYGKLPHADFGTKLNKDKKGKFLENINCYDDSIVYNDFIVTQLISRLDQSNGIRSLLYFSDHADDVFKHVGHNSGLFTFDMTQIPMLFYGSDEYQHYYAKTYQTLQCHRNAFFSNDRIFDTLIGIMGIGIDPDIYSPEFDLGHEKYAMHAEDMKTLHGKVSYTAKNNKFYWQNRNAAELIDTQQDTKFFPHRINSTGKLKEAWALGFRAFEVDVIFDNGTLRTGHNPHEATMGHRLEDFLASIPAGLIKKIWLDIKNINDTNHAQILAELERLHTILDLKNKVIIESSWTHQDFAVFQQHGWHTSYYLPTQKILDLKQRNDETALAALASEIGKQVQSQAIQAVSFDVKNYDFVKQHLEKHLNAAVVYHTWYGPALNDPAFFDRQATEPVFQDKRIKTFLSSFASEFNL